MTTGQKWLGLLILQAGLLGGAYVGGRYPEWKKLQTLEETTQKERAAMEENARHALLLSRARSMLMEAALAEQYHNHGMAFERVIRAQSAVQILKLPLQKEFDEISALLIGQKPEAMDKILAVADKIEPPPKLVPPELSAPAKPAATMVAAAPPTSGPAAAPSPVAPHPTAGPGPAVAEAPRPQSPAVVATAAPPAAGVPTRNGSPDAAIEQSRAALLAAKELLIVGGDTPGVLAKLAHAQVVLEEGNHAEFADQFAAAIKAVRAHDEAKARAALDGILSGLRSL